MLKVKNDKTIRKLSARTAKRTRNYIAIVAIALTTIMFTALFTIGATVINSYEQQQFRQVGGDFHGTFKAVSPEKIEKLASDPLIKSYGVRTFLGVMNDYSFNKEPVEVSAIDENYAKGGFLTPDEGRLPRENTKEVALDTRVLENLGLDTKIGEEITLTYSLKDNGQTQIITDTFILSGIIFRDDLMPVSNVIFPFSYVNQVLKEYPQDRKDSETGRIDMNVYLKNSANIKNVLLKVIDNQGYLSGDQSESQSQSEDSYIRIGVNWGYINAQVSGTIDIGTILSMTGLLIIMMVTGYLIIYNIFQITVINDIRFFGLLKTIGTTKRQIKKMVIRQGLILSVIGIPIGLLLGYFFGLVLSPFVMETLSYNTVHQTANPIIFIGGAFFSLITVFISIRKPAKIAAKVSPLEAIRYLENTKMKKVKKTKKATAFQMALSNFRRSKKKVTLVVLSLSLSVLVLQLTVIFAGGVDMDKYLEKVTVADFLLADAKFLNLERFHSEISLPIQAADAIEKEGNIIEGGKIYGVTSLVHDHMPYQYTKDRYSQVMGGEQLEVQMQDLAKDKNGNVLTETQLYGMEDFPLTKLTLIDGNMEDLAKPNSIIAVYYLDDYGVPEMDSCWAKVGDNVTLSYAENQKFLNPETLEPATDSDFDSGNFIIRLADPREVIYEVVATVTMKPSMGYRRFPISQYILNDETFIKDTRTEDIMLYITDMEENLEDMEGFLTDYTTKINTSLDFESKKVHEEAFEELRNIIILMGGMLSIIIGVVGILNFFNAISTSIITRKHEFAMLQSIGMTGKQLKAMLIYEGVGYAVISVVVSFVLTIATAPLLSNAFSVFWFFTYRFTMLPVLVITPIFIAIGCALPVIIYSIISKQTIVERLRVDE